MRNFGFFMNAYFKIKNNLSIKKYKLGMYNESAQRI